MEKIDLGIQNTDYETLHRLNVRTMQQNYFPTSLKRTNSFRSKSSPNLRVTGHTWIF